MHTHAVSYRTACKALILSLFALVGFVFLLGPFAVAQTAGNVEVPPRADTAIPITWQVLVAAIIASVAIPWLNAFVTSGNAPDWLTSLITAVLAGLTAVGAYLADTAGVPDWKHALGLFFLTVIGAAGFRTSIEPGVEPALKAGGLQLGGPPG